MEIAGSEISVVASVVTVAVLIVTAFWWATRVSNSPAEQEVHVGTIQSGTPNTRSAKSKKRKEKASAVSKQPASLEVSVSQSPSSPIFLDSSKLNKLSDDSNAQNHPIDIPSSAKSISPRMQVPKLEMSGKIEAESDIKSSSSKNSQPWIQASRIKAPILVPSLTSSMALTTVLEEDDEISDSGVSLSVTRTYDGEEYSMTPRDMEADILETPRGRLEWQQFKAATERASLLTRISKLEEDAAVVKKTHEAHLRTLEAEKRDFSNEADKIKLAFDELKKESKLVKAQLEEALKLKIQAQEALAKKNATVGKPSPPKRPKMVDHGVAACIIEEDPEKVQLRRDLGDVQSELKELMNKYKELQIQSENERKSSNDKTNDLVNNVKKIRF